MARHPKPKPIRHPQVGVTTRFRMPWKGALTPRLCEEKQEIKAIGFTADISSRDDED